MVYFLTIIFFKTLSFFLFDIKVKGIENIPDKGPCILISNHSSLLDAPLIGTTVNRRASVLAKKSVFNSAFKQWYLKEIGGVSVQMGNLNKGLIVKTGQIFNRGNMLLIFPEGKINYDEKPGEFGNGFLRLALRFDVPIIPVTIKGSGKLLGKNQKIPKTGKVEIIYGEPIKYDITGRKLSREEMQVAVEECKNIIKNNMSNKLRRNDRNE
jgi:1-acyl-sn-glycerol-3-phosphate acyltransferase